jgi:hypothetical protein
MGGVQSVQFSLELVMKAAFVWAQPIPTDATEWHKALPRVTRKALRVTKTPTNTKANNTTHHSADSVIAEPLSILDPLNDAEYLALNTCDCDAYLNEFGDDYGIDDPATHYLNSGLSIVAPGKDTRRWLKGYNIL